MSYVVGTALLAVVTALACAVPGVFVVLRRNSMLVDGIGHAVLPGIVVGYAITRDLDSPVLVVGAATAGLVVVLGSEMLARTGLVAGDAPQGLIFPALFAAGILLVSLEFSHVHLDAHAVLVGDLNLAAFDEWTIGSVVVGPVFLYTMAGLLVAEIVFLALVFRPLVLATFDPDFARTIGVRTGILNVAFLFVVSVTVTAAFHAAGAILVIALVVVPPATAHLLTTRLSAMMALTVAIAAGGALGGFSLAYVLDAATSAGMAVAYGLVFGGVFGVVRVRARRPRRHPRIVASASSSLSTSVSSV